MTIITGQSSIWSRAEQEIQGGGGRSSPFMGADRRAEMQKEYRERNCRKEETGTQQQQNNTMREKRKTRIETDQSTTEGTAE